MTLCTVLGASGFIGSRLAAHLRAQGHTVQTPQRGDETMGGQPLGQVFYCIGLTADFRVRPLDTLHAHVGVLEHVLRHARFDSLLYLSSTRVYAGADYAHEDADLRVQPQDPSSLYNLSKLAGEALCLHSGRPGVRVARLSNIVGPGMDAASGNFVATLLRDARAGHIELRSSPDSAKDYLHIDDLVAWLPRIAALGQARVYNVASGVQTRHAQWLQWLDQATGCTWAVQAPAPEQSFAPIHIQRLTAEFGVTPRPINDWLAAELSSPTRSHHGQ
jgi:nucleoside-diphosphate-sugar epimerase